MYPLVAIRYAAVTPGSSDLPGGVSYGLWVKTAGTANLTQPDGTDVDGVELLAGFNPFAAKKVRAGGTATGIFALYNS